MAGKRGGIILGGLLLGLLLAAAAVVAAPAAVQGMSVGNGVMSTADHSRFQELNREFTSGPEVTRACLKCHNRAGEQLKGSIHWTWEAPNEKGRLKLGKAHVLNNY